MSTQTYGKASSHYFFAFVSARTAQTYDAVHTRHMFHHITSAPHLQTHTQPYPFLRTSSLISLHTQPYISAQTALYLRTDSPISLHRQPYIPTRTYKWTPTLGVHDLNETAQTHKEPCTSFTQTALQYTVGWLRSVGSIKLLVSFAEYRLFYRALLQKRPIILSILLTEATPYVSAPAHGGVREYNLRIPTQTPRFWGWC